MIGIDIVELDRFDDVLISGSSKVLAPQEQTYLKSRPNKRETLAGLWAAKEAMVKAVGCGFGDITYRQAVVSHDASGKPCGSIIGGLHDGVKFELSISHSKCCAVAVALIYHHNQDN